MRSFGLVCAIAIFVCSLEQIFAAEEDIQKICFEAKTCAHNANEKCGIDSQGVLRRFLDSCDIKEYNCLKHTDFKKTDNSKCADLAPIDDSPPAGREGPSPNNTEADNDPQAQATQNISVEARVKSAPIKAAQAKAHSAQAKAHPAHAKSHLAQAKPSSAHAKAHPAPVKAHSAQAKAHSAQAKAHSAQAKAHSAPAKVHKRVSGKPKAPPAQPNKAKVHSNAAKVKSKAQSIKPKAHSNISPAPSGNANVGSKKAQAS